MPFQYQPFVNPYGASIGELLAHRNDASAHAAEVIGQAQAHAQEVTGQAFGNAAATAGQAISGAIQQQTDPRRKLEQQQVDANTRALAYQTTATNIAKGLVGPNGEQPDPERAGVMMTQAGIPVEAQAPILKSLETGADHRKEAYAEAGHVAYRIIKALPSTASAEDKAHAASAALGASMASDMISPSQGKQLIDALAQGANPLGMALSAMGMSPSGRYKDVIQDETKPVTLAGAARPGGTPATLVSPDGRVIATGATTGPAPLTPEQVALDAATLGTPQETPTAKQSAAAVALTHPKAGSAEQDDQRYRNLVAAKQLNTPISPEDAAWMKGYETQKTITTDKSASAAADRQTAAISAQVKSQERQQNFVQLQAARADIEKNVNTPYLTARTSANTLRDVVTAAQHGNKVAGSLQALETTMAAIRAQGLNRINRTETDMTGDAGSLFDRISGYIGKKVEGQPVPADIQKDMLEFSDILENAAYKKYLTGHKASTDLYGVTDKLKPSLTAPDRSGPISVTDPTGGVHQFKSQADADAFKKAAGIK